MFGTNLGALKHLKHMNLCFILSCSRVFLFFILGFCIVEQLLPEFYQAFSIALH